MFTPPPLRRNYAAALRDLRSQKATVREAAAQDLSVVGSSNARESADALAPLVDDLNAKVRVAALHALGALDARHLLDAIERALDDGDSEVRQAAVITLADIGGERARAAIERALGHGQNDVRYQALLGLCKVAPAHGVDAALELLRSDDLWIAAEAAEQIGLLSELNPELFDDERRARVCEALSETLDEDRPARIGVAAALSLARLGVSKAFPALIRFVRGERLIEGQDAGMLTQDACDVLGSAPAEHADAARAALSMHAWKVVPSMTRTLARASLARLGDRKATLDVVAGVDAFWQSRRLESVHVARRARVREAAPALIARLRRGDTDPLAIVDALEAIGGPEARVALDETARDASDLELREAARAALIRMEEPAL
ncbi:MAG: HEAT repeat domain-containing protein [Polyangiales bacterium]